jgi:DNA polymerase III alpha subunit
VIPLFKTHYSIGRSILNTKDIFKIQRQHDLKEIVVVEDSFYGFRSLNKEAMKNNIKLIFGIRLSVVQSSIDELPSKLIFFAKNNEGMNKIKNLYSLAFENKENVLILNNLNEEELQNIKIAVPFYDSFIYNNLFHFGLCHVDISKFDFDYFIEQNNHPFDNLIKEQVDSFCNLKKKKPILTKSIYHKNKDDFDAFQMYKSICNRANGKTPMFTNPNLNHFCSNEFCWESFLENAKV